MSIFFCFFIHVTCFTVICVNKQLNYRMLNLKYTYSRNFYICPIKFSQALFFDSIPNCILLISTFRIKDQSKFYWLLLLDSFVKQKFKLYIYIFICTLILLGKYSFYSLLFEFSSIVRKNPIVGNVWKADYIAYKSVLFFNTKY